MTKKEFTELRPKEYNVKSDVELIESLDSGVLSEAQRDCIKALLDKRHKIVLQDLTKEVKRSNLATEDYNKRLFWLTLILTVLTLIMVIKLF